MRKTDAAPYADMVIEEIEHLEPKGTGDISAIERLSKDLKAAATKLKAGEVRYLVKQYYAIQEDRIRAWAQMRTALDAGEPNQFSRYMGDQYELLEANLARAMDAFSASKPEGVWLRSITGIGPVLAAGLMAHIDIQRADSPAHIWRFAGLDPTLVWGKGQKRPFNADLKVLCWKVRQSFVKSSGSEHSEYGPIYRARKAYEIERNEAGGNAEAAAHQLMVKKYSPDTEAYAAYIQGKLPKAHIQARAERYTVKLFLSHLWSVLWDIYRPEDDKPAPYALAHLGHVDYMPPPNWP